MIGTAILRIKSYISVKKARIRYLKSPDCQNSCVRNMHDWEAKILQEQIKELRIVLKLLK